MHFNGMSFIEDAGPEENSEAQEESDKSNSDDETSYRSYETNSIPDFPNDSKNKDDSSEKVPLQRPEARELQEGCEPTTSSSSLNTDAETGSDDDNKIKSQPNELVDNFVKLTLSHLNREHHTEFTPPETNGIIKNLTTAVVETPQRDSNSKYQARELESDNTDDCTSSSSDEGEEDEYYLIRGVTSSDRRSRSRSSPYETRRRSSTIPCKEQPLTEYPVVPDSSDLEHISTQTVEDLLRQLTINLSAPQHPRGSTEAPPNESYELEFDSHLYGLGDQYQHPLPPPLTCSETEEVYPSQMGPSESRQIFMQSINPTFGENSNFTALDAHESTDETAPRELATGNAAQSSSQILTQGASLQNNNNNPSNNSQNGHSLEKLLASTENPTCPTSSLVNGRAFVPSASRSETMPYPDMRVPNTLASRKLIEELTPKDRKQAALTLLAPEFSLEKLLRSPNFEDHSYLMAIVRDPKVLACDLKYIIPIVARMKEKKPESLLMRNTRGEDALYLSAIKCPELPFVAGFLAASIAETSMRDEMIRRTYDEGKRNTLIHAVVAEGNSHVLLELLALKSSMGVHFDLSAKNCEGKTALHVAVEVHNPNVPHGTSVNMIRVLLQHGADPTVPENRSGDTALHLAILQRRIDIIQALLQEPGNSAVNVQNYDGNTPVHLAAADSEVPLIIQKQICQMLTDAGGRAYIGNNRHQMPVALVSESRKEEIKNILHKKL